MKTVKVILIKDFKPLGRKNAIIDVNHGYALNFLFPQKIAVLHTEFAINKLKTEISIKEHQKADQMAEENKLKTILEAKELVIKLKSHNHKAIGGVNPSSLSKEIKTQFNLDINKAAFLNKASINTFGSFIRGIKLPHGTISNIKIKVIPQDGNE